MRTTNRRFKEWLLKSINSNTKEWYIVIYYDRRVKIRHKTELKNVLENKNNYLENGIKLILQCKNTSDEQIEQIFQEENTMQIFIKQFEIEETLTDPVDTYFNKRGLYRFRLTNKKFLLVNLSLTDVVLGYTVITQYEFQNIERNSYNHLIEFIACEKLCKKI